MALEAAKYKLLNHQDVFQPSDLPHSRDDPIWVEIQRHYSLKLAEISALKNFSCTELQVLSPTHIDPTSSTSNSARLDESVPSTSSELLARKILSCSRCNKAFKSTTGLQYHIDKGVCTSNDLGRSVRGSSSFLTLSSQPSAALYPIDISTAELPSPQSCILEENSQVASEVAGIRQLTVHALISSECATSSWPTTSPLVNIINPNVVGVDDDVVETVQAADKKKRKRRPIKDAGHATSNARGGSGGSDGNSVGHTLIVNHELATHYGSYESRKRARFDLIKEAAIRYRELTGRSHIPKGVVVPQDSPDWEPRLYGLKLGACFKSIRRHNQYAAYNHELTQEGFDITSKFQSGYDPRALAPSGGGLVDDGGVGSDPLAAAPSVGSHLYSDQQILIALNVYKEKYGNMKVPIRFEVPSNSDGWPESTWDMKLGIHVSQIRQGKRMKNLKAELEAVGFDFAPQRNCRGFEATYASLVQYKYIHGTVKVPKTFVVPSNDSQWPQDKWDFPLGRQIASVRKGTIFYDKRAEFEELGVEYREVAAQRSHVKGRPSKFRGLGVDQIEFAAAPDVRVNVESEKQIAVVESHEPTLRGGSAAGASHRQYSVDKTAYSINQGYSS